ncbi:hypothetical protein A5667_27450 [Mycolicibacterium fortuitum]|nr:hypothetical protein A5667_27450 [Mycolicibacterium fortuitum]
MVHYGRSQGEPVPLESGLYSVDVILPEGEARSVVVNIEHGSTTHVDLADLAKIAASPSGARLGLPEHDPGRPPSAGMDVDTNNLRFEVMGQFGCRSIPTPSGQVEIIPAPHKSDELTPARVPVVVVQWIGRETVMSVPVNPRGKTYEDQLCVLTVINEGGLARLRMTFSPQRVVSRAIEGLMRHRTADEIGDQFDVASQLLLEKYSDPAGAALGALALHAMGRMGEHDSWVENLARDFPWIPDGRIVTAARMSLSQDAVVRRRGLSILLNACRQRPMYTDGLSLGMQLLRHWPDDRREAERSECLDGLATLAANTDWNSLNLTTYRDRQPRMDG